MKKILISGIVTLLVGFLISYFANSLNKEYVDLRYTLSEKIPTKFLETSPAENVQQLVVKNNGNIAAQNIRIKINSSIEDFDILKYSISDEVKEYKSTEHFESVYPSLPPEAQFVYVFKTSGSGITKSGIEIIHSKGRAKEALAGVNQSIFSKIGEYVFYGLILFYVVFLIFFITISGRTMVIDRLESEGTYTKYNEYLNKKKPFSISQEKWESIRKKYIESKRKAGHLYVTVEEVEEQESYKILQNEKPKFVTEDEWVLLKESATKCLEDQLIYLIKTTFKYRDFESLFKLERPKYFIEKKWDNIVDEINKNFMVQNRFPNFFNDPPEELIKQIENGRPPGMQKSFWDKYRKFLQKRCFEILCGSILSFNYFDPLDYLSKYNLKLLGKDEQDKLQEVAYKIQLLGIDDISSSYHAEKFLETEKPEWIKLEDYKRLEKKANSYINLEKEIRQNEDLSEALRKIISLAPLGLKPESLTDIEWGHLQNLETKISTVAIEIEKEREELNCDKMEHEKLKDKILRQLRIVDNVLSSPESINKIEEYDNPFSKGNFENIQRVAAYLIELQQSNI